MQIGRSFNQHDHDAAGLRGFVVPQIHRAALHNDSAFYDIVCRCDFEYENGTSGALWSVITRNAGGRSQSLSCIMVFHFLIPVHQKLTS